MAIRVIRVPNRVIRLQMNELLYKEDAFQLVGFCMQVHRELGKGHDEIIYKDAFVVELSRAGIPFLREQFRWRFARVEKGCLMRHEFHEFALIPSNAESE